MSLSERKTVASKYPWILPQLTETHELMRPITRRPPGDNSIPEVMTMGRMELARRKSNYYDGAFSVNGAENPRRERILGDSMVMVELKTNVIVSPVFAKSGFYLFPLAILGWSQVSDMVAYSSARLATNSSSSRNSQRSSPSDTNGHYLPSRYTCSTRAVYSLQGRSSQPTPSLSRHWHHTSSP